MRINVNLDEVKELSAVPAGEYLCKVMDGEVKKGPKGDYISWQLSIAEGERAGAMLFHNTSLLPKALFNLKAFLTAVGFEWEEEGFEIEDVFGSEVYVNVAVEDYEGKEVNKIKGFIPA